MINKLYRGYQYLFYKFYTWDVWLNRGKDPSAYQAGWFMLSLWGSFNFLTLLLIFEIFTGYGFYQIAHLSKLSMMAIGTFFLSINYLIFVRKKKYIEVIKRFRNESRKSRIIGNILTWVYVISTLAATGFFARLLGILRLHN